MSSGIQHSTSGHTKHDTNRIDANHQVLWNEVHNKVVYVNINLLQSTQLCVMISHTQVMQSTCSLEKCMCMHIRVQCIIFYMLNRLLKMHVYVNVTPMPVGVVADATRCHTVATRWQDKCWDANPGIAA